MHSSSVHAVKQKKSQQNAVEWSGRVICEKMHMTKSLTVHMLRVSVRYTQIE